MGRVEQVRGRLSQHQIMQIPLDNHVLHALHRLVQEVRVGCICKMDIGVLVGIPHQISEFARKEVLPCLDIILSSREVREVFLNRCSARLNLLSEEVDLVEEEDEGGLFKVFAVGDALKQHEGFVHLILYRSQLPIATHLGQGRY